MVITTSRLLGQMTERKPPMTVVLKELLPIDTAKELAVRWFEPDWDAFFQSLFSVGLTSISLSMVGFLLVLGLSEVVSESSGVADLLVQVVSNLSFFAVAAFVATIVILKGVEGTIEGRVAVVEFDEETEELGRRFQQHPLGKAVVYVVGLVIACVLLSITWVFRQVLIIGDVPSGMSLVDTVTFYFVMFMFDLAYIGLVLVSAGQVYSTIRVVWIESS